MARHRTLEERLQGAALFRLSFELRGQAEEPAFLALFPGVLADLQVTEAAVTTFLNANRDALVARIREGRT